MTKQPAKQPKNLPYQPGISIIILTNNGAHLLDRLFATFFEKNTYHPIELIVVDHASTDDTDKTIAKYKSRAYIRHLKRDQNYSCAASNNLAAQKAAYPNLLFMHNDILFTSDALPQVAQKLADPSIGAVGIRLDANPENMTRGKTPAVQQTGITFTWDLEKEFYRPANIFHQAFAEAEASESSFPHAVTGAFLLCRKADFEAVGGFCEEYDYGFEDIDFCLQLKAKLNKKSCCLNYISLQHLEGSTSKKIDPSQSKRRKNNNDYIFKQRMGEAVKNIMEFSHQDNVQDTAQDKGKPTSSYPQGAHSVAPRLHVLFVLPSTLNSSYGYQVQQLMDQLRTLDVECVVAVPDAGDIMDNVILNKSYTVLPFEDVIHKGIPFTTGSVPDIIHAWTPREIVRSFVDSIKLKYPCPVIVHITDNEAHLTEITTGRPCSELENISALELDSLIPRHRFHPVKGKRWLKEIQGLTISIDTLKSFNQAALPCLTISPVADERLFYPRPLNYDLRREYDIPDNHLVLVYPGSLYDGNVDEVLTLYHAARLLNEKGHPTTLIRTGVDYVQPNNDTVFEGNNIKNLGWVNRKEIPSIMAAANVFVHSGSPGLFNDYRIPCKLPEYFALGRPLILPRTNLGLLAEHEKEAYILNEVNAETISDTVIKLLANNEHVGKLAAGAAGFYRSILSCSLDKNNLLSLYEHCKKEFVIKC